MSVSQHPTQFCADLHIWFHIMCHPNIFFLQTCLSFSMYSEFMKHRDMGSDLGIPCSHFSFLRSATQHQRRVPRPSICSDSFSLSSPLLFSSPLLIYPFTALPLFHPGCFSLLRPQNFTAHSLQLMRFQHFCFLSPCLTPHPHQSSPRLIRWHCYGAPKQIKAIRFPLLFPEMRVDRGIDG